MAALMIVIDSVLVKVGTAASRNGVNASVNGSDTGIKGSSDCEDGGKPRPQRRPQPPAPRDGAV
eukprot:2581578-Rhodomonas_salina.1